MDVHTIQDTLIVFLHTYKLTLKMQGCRPVQATFHKEIKQKYTNLLI